MKYFIDCGAHCGESIVRAKQQFGPEVVIISFEAVPELANQLIELYKDDDAVSIQNSAVYIKDGSIEFNLSPAFTDGSSILNTLNNNHLGNQAKVPCFDISKWIKQTFDINDYIILKLDIEGAEYDVIEKLYEDGNINMISELWGEWHEGHIKSNLSTDDAKIFQNKVDNVYSILKKSNKELKIWEAYYNKYDTNLTKRPETLTN